MLIYLQISGSVVSITGAMLLSIRLAAESSWGGQGRVFCGQSRVKSDEKLHSFPMKRLLVRQGWLLR
jgi:hypothetical protein